nr:general secretion pathway protein GspB [Psychrosphaera haliotis]
MESDAIEQLPSSRPSELLTQAPDEQLSGTSQLITEKQLETDKKQLETGKEEAIDEPEQLVINVADINSSNVKVEDVSSDLQARFAEALAQTEVGTAKKTNNQQRSIQVEVDSSLVDINDLPDGDRAFIPELQYEMHIYSSDVNERWVRINNTTLYEGDRLTPYLRLAEIRQGIVIWESRERRFSQVALEDYK